MVLSFSSVTTEMKKIWWDATSICTVSSLPTWRSDSIFLDMHLYLPGLQVNFSFNSMFNRFMARWTLIGALVVSFCFHASAQEGKRHGGTGMLVLGSANLSTLKTRVEVAYKLYASGIAFDYI